jgi:eukaryotic-like serine/threonine-protein kinase
VDQAPRLGGRYEIGPILGRGGMAEVRLGTDIRLGREVAVKRLRSDLAMDATFQARFRREAQAAAGLNHPNIVAVYDTGEEMAPDGTHVQPFIVMERVEGRTLREVLNDDRKLLPERALEIISGVLGALDYSHRAGIVHRDIKPGNVMLTPDGQVKVMDFGIARAVADATSVTQTSAVVGTAQYLSPEQARGETVDSRSDIYSAGCLLYELLASRPPFTGDSPFSVAYQHVREQADPPSTHNADIPPALDAIVMKALAKRVEDRYQSAAEMLSDVRRHLDGEPVEAPTAMIAAAPVVSAPEPEPTSLFRGAPEDEEPRRRRWPIVALVLLLVLLLAGAVLAGLQMFGGGGPEQVSVPDVTNMTEQNAERRLRQEGLRVGDVDQETSDSVPQGRVISQDPGADETVDEGSEIDLLISAGKEPVVVKHVLGLSKDEATRIMEGLGLEVRYQTRASSEPKDVVVATDPNAGETVPVGSTVTLVLSEGQRTVPTVVGRSEAEARTTLQGAGFQVEVQYDDSTPSRKGVVLRQDPAGDTQARPGSTVTITVSDYVAPEPTREPRPSPDRPSPDGNGNNNNGNNNNGGGGPDRTPPQPSPPAPDEPPPPPAGEGGGDPPPEGQQAAAQ